MLRSRGERALVVAVYLEAALSALGRALIRDPFFDPTCWDNCTDNVFLVRSLPDVASAIQDADLWFAAAAAAALAAVCVGRLAAASGPARRALWPVLAGGIALAGATIAHSIALTRVPVEDPGDGVFLAIFVVGCAAVVVIALGLPWTLVQARMQRRFVARIVADLGEAPSPGSLESALAKAIGDPELRIAYWLPGARTLRRRSRRPGPSARGRVRARGHAARAGRPPSRPRHAQCGGRRARARDRRRCPARARERAPAGRGAGAARGSARVTHADRRVGRRGAAPARARPPRRRAAAAAGALLRPTTRARRRSRRRRRGARPRCSTPPATRPRPHWKSCASSPTGSTRRSSPRPGLAPALEALADEAPLPVELDEVASERQPPAVETTAYVTVAEAIEDAARRGAPFLVRSRRHARAAAS